MTLFADEDGRAVRAEGSPVLTEEMAALVRAIMVVRWRRRRVAWRAISLILNTPEATLRRRYERMPVDVRDRYERMPLGDLFGL